jgi:hypothetical protein
MNPAKASTAPVMILKTNKPRIGVPIKNKKGAIILPITPTITKQISLVNLYVLIPMSYSP